jgi:hypothetical protein
MKRRIVLGLVALFSVFAVTGCGGGYSEGYDDGYDDGFYDGARMPGAGMTTLFLVDIDGFSAGGVPYSCVSPDGRVTDRFVTAPNGEFSFIPGERCTFDLLGFGGYPDDPLYIEDDIGRGKEDIPYACDGGDGGFTDRNGMFIYLPDDVCTFYF